MLIQFILSGALAAMFVYAQLQRQTSAVVGLLTSAGSLAGLLLVWTPSLANDLAHAVGVGRGSDLVFYVFIATAGFISLYLHLRLEGSNQAMTELARTVALARPRWPGQALGGPT